MSKKLQADLALLFITFIWGSTFVLVKEGIKDLPPYTFMFIRFCIGTAFLCLLFPKKLRNIDNKALLYGSIIGVAVFAGYAFQTIGLKYTTVSKSAFITGLSVVLVPILSLLLTGQKPSWQAVIGVALSLAGLMMLTLGGNGISGINKGDLYTLLSAVAFAAVIILIDIFTMRSDSTVLAIIQTLTVTLLNLVFMLWRETDTIISVDITPIVYLSLSVTGIMATGLASYIQNRVQRLTTPTHTALIFACEPVFGAIFAFILVGERLTWIASLGCLLILLGTITAEIKPRQQQTDISIHS